MAQEKQGDFLSSETENKIAAFEAKLKAEQAAMPDTSIRTGTGGINAPENYYFRDESIPIFDAGTNKQIDRIDMEVDRLRRTRRTKLADEVDEYMREIRAEIKAKEENGGVQPPEPGLKKTPAFVWGFALFLVLFGILMAVVTSL